jgi:FkbM family methyltransferase
MLRLIRENSINLLVDVGANQGQYAERMRATGFQGTIQSFEPSGEAFALLSARAQRDGNWVAHHLALGAISGQATLSVSNDSVSSSLLKVADPHLRVAPKSARAYAEQVRVSTLDEVLATTTDSRLWLKLDTQGSEDRVIAGAERTMASVRVLQIELSLVECYEGQADYRQIIDQLHASGFRLVMVEPGTQDVSTGELLQFDATFVRKMED